MSKVGSKDTAPEKVVRSRLHQAGYRFRLHVKELPGSPDVVLPRYRLVIFVNGCFWHQHAGCSRARVPQQNRQFWTDKLRRNVERDRRTRAELKSLDWRVTTVWECELADEAWLDRTVALIAPHEIEEVNERE